MRNMHKTLFLVGALVGAGLAILVTRPGVMSVGVSAVAAAPDTYQGLSLFGEVFDRVRADYVDRPDDHKLIESRSTACSASLILILAI